MKSNQEMKDIVESTILDSIEKWFDHAEKAGMKLKDLPLPEIKFNVTSDRINGVCCSDHALTALTLDFNMNIMRANFEEFVKQTVVHEVAHYCVLTFCGHEYTRSGSRVMHGKNWKWMMNFFGIQANRCTTHANATVSTVSKKKKTHSHDCNCMTHELSTIRHNRRIRGQAQYRCNKCGSDIK